MSDYLTWYQFKKDLEREAGRSLLNEDWLRIKPAAPLPWSRHSLDSSLVKLGRLHERKSGRGEPAAAE